MFVFCLIVFNIIFQCVANTEPSHPVECGLNEKSVKCKTTCPPQSCNLAYTEYLCDPNPNPKCVPGCDCIENYLRDDTGKCIFNEDCPYPLGPPLCGEFEEPIISNDSDIQRNSENNCKCIDKYTRNSNGTCVPIAQTNTIKCGFNEVPSDCKQTCPPQDCDFSYDKYACKPGPCSPGCNCIGDYLRNSSGDCVPKDQCDTDEEYEEPSIRYTSRAKASSSASAYASSSAYSFASASSNDSNTNIGGTPCIYDRCTPTCSVPNPSNCPQTSNPCNCAAGYILSEKGGQCVKLEECQKYLNCNGDRNATQSDCPNPCKSTCKKPNAVCTYDYSRRCDVSGCQCEPLYLLSDEGKCILPDDCPGGNPCSRNETFVFCKVGCPTIYCPTSDSRAIVACSQPYPCPSGCSCKPNHRRVSYTDDRCILASDCPPVNCTRQNEEWNPCPPACFTEICQDLNQPPRECYQYGLNCQPQCVCKDGYRRNDKDICIPISEC